MKVAIMQPYIFPYIGYFQLIKEVDKFILLDDAAFIKKGWINRNNILINGKASLFTIPVRNASQNVLIKDIEIANEEYWQKKLLKTIIHAYSKAPLFSVVFPLLEKLFSESFVYINHLSAEGIKVVCNYLDLTTEILTQDIDYANTKLRGEMKIIDICKQKNASKYINPKGGLGLYSKENFEQKNISLLFLHPAPTNYPQFKNEFVPNLSMIDVLMFNDKEKCKKMLNEYFLQ